MTGYLDLRDLSSLPGDELATRLESAWDEAATAAAERGLELDRAAVDALRSSPRIDTVLERIDPDRLRNAPMRTG